MTKSHRGRSRKEYGECHQEVIIRKRRKRVLGFPKLKFLDVRTREDYLGLVETSLVSNYNSIWGRGRGEIQMSDILDACTVSCRPE